jgi:hypothetical protein
MSRLIAVLLLSMLMLPLAALVYTLVAVAYAENAEWTPRREETAMIFGGAAAWAFIACYWFALWGRSVRWNVMRATWTVAGCIVSLVAGVIVGALFGLADDELGYFFGSATSPVFWLVATIFIWRETPAERAARAAHASGAAGVVCPTCGYNLTGLKITRCPECSSEFTLDQLFSGQPGKEQTEVEA